MRRHDWLAWSENNLAADGRRGGQRCLRATGRVLDWDSTIGRPTSGYLLAAGRCPLPPSDILPCRCWHSLSSVLLPAATVATYCHCCHPLSRCHQLLASAVAASRYRRCLPLPPLPPAFHPPTTAAARATTRCLSRPVRTARWASAGLYPG